MQEAADSSGFGLIRPPRPVRRRRRPCLHDRPWGGRPLRAGVHRL